MAANEQAFRNQIVFQLGIFAGTIVSRKDFDISDFVEPIVHAAKKMAAEESGDSSTE